MQITRKKLRNYPKLIWEIKLLRQELAEMKTSDAGIGHSIINDYSKGYARPQAVVGFDEERYKRKERVLWDKEREEEFIRHWIDDIEDTVTRTVFRLHYVNEMKWAEVAKQIGYGGNPDYPRKYIRDAYLEKLRIK